jgi:hypothetical protein
VRISTPNGRARPTAIVIEYEANSTTSSIAMNTNSWRHRLTTSSTMIVPHRSTRSGQRLARPSRNCITSVTPSLRRRESHRRNAESARSTISAPELISTAASVASTPTATSVRSRRPVRPISCGRGGGSPDGRRRSRRRLRCPIEDGPVTCTTGTLSPGRPEAVLAEPRARDRLRRAAADLDLDVHRAELLRRERRRDRVEHPPESSQARQRLAVDHRRDVVRRLEVAIVLEEDGPPLAISALVLNTSATSDPGRARRSWRAAVSSGTNEANSMP